ncbi:hypothetical protein H5185_14450 [Shewanella sp. SG44-6]|uniref:hypothetical protein n=1 Tax=Shewanella sp. SG44-6 TaxID=2760959 RepID=UPI001600DC8B|nr:hypothetical protein [Shewanella sp. SG44-6]MBB1390605.1 hypothetical protein [Shewanella sp. SG44-6]
MNLQLSDKQQSNVFFRQHFAINTSWQCQQHIYRYINSMTAILPIYHHDCSSIWSA